MLGIGANRRGSSCFQDSSSVFSCGGLCASKLPDAQAAYYRQVAQYDHAYTAQLEQLYPELNVPFLVLWRERDQWVDIAVGRRLQQMVPKAELRVLPDAGHAVVQWPCGCRAAWVDRPDPGGDWWPEGPWGGLRPVVMGFRSKGPVSLLAGSARI